MDMKTSVSGRNIAKAMRQLARDAFAEYPNVGCVCVGVKNIGGRHRGHRTEGDLAHAQLPESNLALFLYKQGVDFSGVVIASYETVGGSISFKPLCRNCAQWVRQHFKVLVEFDSSVRT